MADSTTYHSGRRVISAAVFPLIFVGLMWAVHLIGTEFQISISRYGLFPRTIEGLRGIFTMPFIHGSFSHLINNSAPMLVLGWMLFHFYPTLAWKTLLGIWIIAGIWLWISGRESYHIGASGIVYGLASFLFLSGWLRREKRVASLSFVVVFLYGGMWWGILPVDPGISWEGHLWGGIAGFALAIFYRKQGPQRPVYQWETEPEEDEEFSASAEIAEAENSNDKNENATYVYTFIPEKRVNKD